MLADLVSLHEDAFGLPDEISGGHSFVELALLLRIGQGQGRVCGQTAADVFGSLVERLGRPRVQIESTEAVGFDIELERKHASHSLSDRTGGESWPAGAGAEIRDPHNAVFPNGVETGALMQLRLQGVQSLGDEVRGCPGANSAIAADDRERRVIGTWYDSHRFVDHHPEDEIVGFHHEGAGPFAEFCSQPVSIGVGDRRC